VNVNARKIFDSPLATSDPPIKKKKLEPERECTFVSQLNDAGAVAAEKKERQ
jgi:hypothetical protein